MSIVPSLLQAIVKVDGVAMVMHAGDKPYVVAPAGQVELASRGLTLSAVNGIVTQLLPTEILNALEEFGAISYELPFRPEFPNEHFTCVAARGGDDVWVEIRRRRIPDDDRVPEDIFEQQLPPSPAVSVAVAAPPAVMSAPVSDPLSMPAAAEYAPSPVASVAVPQSEPVVARAVPSPLVVETPRPDVMPQAAADVRAASPVEAQLETPKTGAVAPDLDEREVEIALDDDDLTLPEEAQLFGRPASAFTDSELADGEEQEIDLDADLDVDDDVVAPALMAEVPAPAVVHVADAIAEQALAVHEMPALVAHVVEPPVMPAVVAPIAVLRSYLAPPVTSPIAEARFAPVEIYESRVQAPIVEMELQVAAPATDAIALEEPHVEAVAQPELHVAPEVVEAVASVELAETEAHVELAAVEAIAIEETHVEAVAESELHVAPEVVEAVASVELAETEAHVELPAVEAIAIEEMHVEAVAESELHVAPEVVEAVASVELTETEAHVELPAVEAVAMEESHVEAVAESELHVSPEVVEAVASVELAEPEAHVELPAVEAVAMEESHVEAVAESELHVAPEVVEAVASVEVTEPDAHVEVPAVEAVAIEETHVEAVAEPEPHVAPEVVEAVASVELAETEAHVELPVVEAIAPEETQVEAVAESELHAVPEVVEAVASAELAEPESHVELPVVEAVASEETRIEAVAEPELYAAPEVVEAAASVELTEPEQDVEPFADVESGGATSIADVIATAATRHEPIAEPEPFVAASFAEVPAAVGSFAASADEPASPMVSRFVAVESRDASEEAEELEAPRPVSRAADRDQPAPSQPAVVLPISRSPIRGDQPAPIVPDVTVPGLDRLLRLASARAASTLYLSSESRPSVRVDGELQILDAEPVHSARDVQSLMLTLMPERNHEALRTGALTEWICDIDGVGRVRCMSFRDHLGPGGVFRLMPTRSVSVEQLGLPRHVQSLAIEPEGLILVTGPRSSGKRTLMAAFVDLMNRTRREHIITIEREINIVHEGGQSFISQREVRGNDDELLAAARAALREDPDVLVIEDLHTAALMNVALEAAASGHLVVGGFSAHTATGAIDRIIDLYAPEQRRHVQFALAESLRGVIVQVLLKKIGGGRLPAREVLLNTPAVSTAIVEGKTSQLPMAIEGGRRHGMIPLNDALIGLVQSCAVETREAYRQSPDRPGFLAALKRHGLDTSDVERFA